MAGLSVILALSFAGCQSNHRNISADNSGNKDSLVTISLQKDTTAKQDSVYEFPDSQVSFMLPSPDEILGEILSTRMDYNVDYLNSRKNASKYIDTRKKALNLGVYLSDLAYANLNEDKTEAFEYFKVVRDLAQKIQIYQVFNQRFYDRIQANLTKKDSLNAISKEIYYKVLDVLESSKRNNIYALVASGALIEALYLSSVSVKNYADYKPVAQKIFEQKYVLNNFYEFASQYRKDPNVDAVLKLAENLKNILNNAGVKVTNKKVTVESKNHLVISGGEDIVVTEDVFNIFRSNVIKIRSEIISL
jgi:hypothetical protein